jgi:hypothetical protein
MPSKEIRVLEQHIELLSHYESVMVSIEELCG